MSIALYVHFPFCLSICPYCDFDRQASGFDRVEAYLAAVVAELRGYGGTGETIHSVFFGGGTPSLMRPDQVRALLEAARETLAVAADAEVTLEANPGDADAEKMHGFRAAGVNRLSIGLQSLDDRMLRRLGRRHTAAEGRQAARWAREAGLRLNLDLMYGLPGQDLAHWAGTLDATLALEPNHLSCYLLTLDEHVPMGRAVARGRLQLPSDEVQAEMYEHARLRLEAAGFQQYEISNWARPGEQSRHNLTYWRDQAWIGVGAGAASSFGGWRWKNTPRVERYLRSVQPGGRVARVEEEQPDLATRMLDHLALGLRLREGVSLAEFERRFGARLREVLGDELDWMARSGALELCGDRLRIAAEHQLVTNEVLARLAGPVRGYASGRENGREALAAVPAG